MKRDVAGFKTKNPHATKEEISKYEQEDATVKRQAAVNKLKKNWSSEQIPTQFVVFVLCGAPGLNLTCLAADDSGNQPPGTKHGRRMLRQLEQTESGVRLAIPVKKIETEGVAIKRKAVALFESKEKREKLNCLIHLLEEAGEQETESYKHAKAQLRALLLADLYPKENTPEHQTREKENIAEIDSDIEANLSIESA